LKLTVASSDVRVKIHSVVRQHRGPTSLFSNDFLTKTRSQLAFDMRNLKKRNQSKIRSTYVLNGHICCQISTDGQIHYINTPSAFANLVTKFKLNYVPNY